MPKPPIACSWLLLALAACTAEPAAGPSGEKDPQLEPTTEQQVELDTTAVGPVIDRVDNLAAGSNFDLFESGERTRAMVAADFDNDGLDDFFIGNPGDPSFVVLNRSIPGEASFVVAQVLSEGHLSWTAAAADFDNDGDVDLVVGGGGNECQDVDQLWQNQLMETGTVSFVEVWEEMGLSRGGELDVIATTGVRWADFDRDGWLDLYVGYNPKPRCGKTEDGTEQNQLWRNLGGHGFENVTQSSGIDTAPLGSTRHPAIIDLDGDGDLDIFDSNTKGNNVFLNNLLVETGELVFGSLDPELLDGADTSPKKAFASCVGDFDNDGLDDLLVVNRVASECSTTSPDADAASTGFGQVHRLYRNTGGALEDISEEAGLEVQSVGIGQGVMGCQIGDLNGDGALDVFIGNGGPDFPGANDLFIGSPTGTAFANESALVRTPKAWRTHGSIIADIDGDSVPELVVGNGGPSNFEDVAEPNQMLSFRWLHEAYFLEVRLKGDGVLVNRDAIGAKAELVFTDDSGAPTRSLFRSVRGGNCFSADNGHGLYFGLVGNESSVPGEVPHHLDITWPDGTTSSHEIALKPNSSGAMSITYGE